MLLIISANSCKKESETIDNNILYPETSQYGQNILALADGTILSSDTNYGLCVNLGEDAILKIVITNLTNNDTVTSSSNYGGWFITYDEDGGLGNLDYDEESDSQVFEPIKSGTCDREINFKASGECKIEYYENTTDEITATKILTWSKTGN